METEQKAGKAIEEKDLLNNRLEQQTLMTYVSQSLLSGSDLDEMVTNAFRMIGEFMGISQILLFVSENNGETFICRNEWVSPEYELDTHIGSEFVFADLVMDLLRGIKQTEKFYLTSDVPGMRDAMGPYRSNFRNNFLATCLFRGDEPYVLLDFARADDDTSTWSQDDENMVSFVSNIISGILHRQAIEKELVDAKNLAENANRHKSSFLTAMSHEIRTPMNTILGIAEMQLQKEGQAPEMEEAFIQIYESGSLLLDLINGILDMSKIETGKLEISPIKYDLPSLVNDTAQLNYLRYESKPIKFIVKVDENTPVHMFGDEIRIKQILNNLLSNAFKYTIEGEVELSVKAEYTYMHGYGHGDEDEDEDGSGRENGNDDDVTLVLTVRDTGQGMTAEQVEKMFEVYTRFNLDINRATTGTGLGMGITKHLVYLMHGEIYVKSAPVKGTRVTVRLPQKYVGDAVCGPISSEDMREYKYKSMSKIKNLQLIREYMPYGSVLVVDDVESNLYVAKGLLSPYGLHIDTASGGQEAIGKIKRGTVYDIVFMDHMMPFMDGIETTKALRDSGYKRPIVALTANAFIGQAEMFLENGFDNYISKPIDTRELDVILNELIRAKQPPEVVEAARRRVREKNGGAVGKAIEDQDLSEVFIIDAEKAAHVLENYCAYKGGGDVDIRLYTITVHGMKSALANIGEKELSEVAYRLQRAGDELDAASIFKETPAFLERLRALIAKMKPQKEQSDNLRVSEDDTAYLRYKLLAVKAACASFDIVAAKSAADELRKREWPRQITDLLDAISAFLLHSAFVKATNAADNALSLIDDKNK